MEVGSHMSSVENNSTFECSRPWIVDDEKAFTEYHVSGVIIASMRRDTGSKMVWNLFKMSEAVPQNGCPSCTSLLRRSLPPPILYDSKCRCSRSSIMFSNSHPLRTFLPSSWPRLKTFRAQSITRPWVKLNATSACSRNVPRPHRNPSMLPASYQRPTFPDSSHSTTSCPCDPNWRQFDFRIVRPERLEVLLEMLNTRFRPAIHGLEDAENAELLEDLGGRRVQVPCLG
ncbi:hypothetical protein B0H13DRAFT_1133750 [Mycena leptocephala]|nr:hypothetical protein B0H13DRAFT_1133750 [Mycena leptocephala]